MKLHIENLAKIASADITIDRITIIAGENNTGKSTIGKALFSIFDTLSDLSEEYIEDIRQNAIIDTCEEILRNSDIQILKRDFSIYTAFGVSPVQKKILEGIREIVVALRKNKYDKSSYNWEKELSKLIHLCIYRERGIKEKREQLISTLKEEIQNHINLSPSIFVASLMNRSFNRHFNTQINCLLEQHKHTSATISLTIQGKNISLAFLDDICYEYKSGLEIKHTVYGLDNIPSDLESYMSYFFQKKPEKDHKKLFTDEVRKKDMAEIISKISDIISGVFVREKGEYSLRTGKHTKPLNVKNLSDGLKFFALIKLLVENGLNKRDVLILDEPETHLHPDWQIKFAELIVLVQKKLNLSVLISTHSPYMVEALNVYSAYHGIADGVNYYLSELDKGGRGIFSNVNEDIGAIYQKLVDPISVLEEVKLKIH